MEAKELRISNTINHKEKGLITIKGITEHCGDYKIDTDLGWVYLKNCEPIETTGERLVELGFECDNFIEYNIENEKFIFSMYFHDCWHIYYKEKKGFGADEINLTGFWEIHEVQNLYFALTNEELTHE